MRFSYNKLWKILIDYGMMKKDLAAKANITSTTMAKMGKDMPVSMEILGRICVALKCNIGDIVDVIIDDTKEAIQLIRFTSGSLFKVISLCKSGRRYSDDTIASMFFPNVQYTTNYIGHVKDCTKNLPDEITQFMSESNQEDIIETNCSTGGVHC